MSMSNLQMGLAIAGGLVLLAMGLHGAWTFRKNLPRQASPDEPHSQFDINGVVEPGFDPAAFDGKKFTLPGTDKKPSMDSLIDVIATIALESPASGDVALAAMPATRRVGSKPLAIEGLNEVGQHWEIPLPGQRYTTFQAGVQLANRSGALNDIEYSEFVVKTQTFCDAVNGTPDFPEMREQVARARELDQFASDHDAQLCFVLRAINASWSPGYVQQRAARFGFIPGVIPGRLVIPAGQPGLPPILSMNFDTQAAIAEDPALSAIRELVISLDVAQVSRSEEPFVRMREALSSLAESMEGVVTDDNCLPLPIEAMDVIAAELNLLYDTLDRRDLSAGSVLARRLFS